MQVRGQIRVLQAQRVGIPARCVHAVGQSARLGTRAAIAAALPQHRAHLALSRIAHAQCAVAEDLNLRPAPRAYLRDLIAIQLPRQHHALHAQLGGGVRPAPREKAHLCAGVEGQVGDDLLCQRQKSPVLHEHRVHAHGVGAAQCLRRLRQLAIRHQRVQRQEYPHPAQMAVPHRRRKFLVGKIPRAPPRIERAEAHIHRVRAALHGGDQRVNPSRGRQKLHHPRRLFWFCAFCSLRRSSDASFLARLASSR